MAQSMKTILVTDDDKMILEGFKDLFERRAIASCSRTTGRSRLPGSDESTSIWSPSDIVMPYEEGLETLIEIRRRFPDMPIYSMTAGQTQQAGFLWLAQKLGATGTLLKPIEPTVLLKLAQEASARAV